MSSLAGAPRFAPSRTRLLLVVAGGLLCQMGLGYNYVFGALAPEILADLAWTKSEFAGARAPQLWVMALASPLFGFLAVRFGPRRVLLTSLLLLGASFLLLARMDSLVQFYALLAVQALAVTGLGDVTVGQLVSLWFQERRGLVLGLVYTGSNLGGALIVGLVGWIAAPGAWRGVFEGMGAIALLVLLPVVFFALGASRPGTSAASVAPAPSAVGEARDLDLSRAWRTRSFWILAFSLMTFFFYFVAMLDHFVLFLTEQEFSLEQARGYLAKAILLGMVSKVGFGWVADRLRPRTAALVDFGLLAASSSLLLLPPSPMTIGVFVVVFGFATAARDVVYPLVLGYCFGVRSLAQIYGVLMLALPMGALGAWFAAAVSEASGDYGGAFLTFLAGNGLAFLALCFLRDEREVLTCEPALV